MQAELAKPVNYFLPIGEERVPLNPLLGEAFSLEFTGQILCQYCGRKTKKSFNQGFCYPCFQKLARCDSCIVSPEKCHYAAGTCREPEWAADNCMIEHVVYLANTSGAKVGITRGTQVPTRWIDQGATQALPILSVQSRLQSGLLEYALKQHIADKTQWQTMLKGNGQPCDLKALKQNLLDTIKPELQAFVEQHGVQAVTELASAEVVDIDYPVLNFPQKVKSFNFDKQAKVEGVLQGIKGQYLIFDTGVINIRKFTAYEVEFCRAA